MDIMPNLAEDRQVIQRYGAGGFTVNGTSYTQALAISAAGVTLWDGAMEPLTVEMLAGVLDAAPVDILILGMGLRQQMISPKFRQAVKERWGAVIEAMDTGAACRTFNVLVAEDRRVAAILMPV